MRPLQSLSFLLLNVSRETLFLRFYGNVSPTTKHSHTRTQSKRGQIADGEADFYLYLALSIILVQNTILPLWLGIALVLRFFVPLLAALASYFLFARAVRLGSTVWGKYAGLAQCLYFFVLLAPPQFAFVAHVVNLPLLIALLVLVAAAPIAQIVGNMHGKIRFIIFSVGVSFITPCLQKTNEGSLPKEGVINETPTGCFVQQICPVV